MSKIKQKWRNKIILKQKINIDSNISMWKNFKVAFVENFGKR